MEHLIKKLTAALVTLAMILSVITMTGTQSVSAKTKKTVKSVTITNVEDKKLTLEVGQTFTLEWNVVVTGNASKKVTFKSSKSKVATVSKGVIKAKKPGTSTITVASKVKKSKKAKIKVTVVKKGAASTSTPEQESTSEESTEDDSTSQSTSEKLPAVDFTDKDKKVKVKAPEGAFPEGTTMSVTDVNAKDVEDAVNKVVDGEITNMKALDISFANAEGKEIEPKKEVTVELTADIVEEPNLQVVHIDDEGKATLIKDVKIDDDTATLTFNQDEFSKFALVSSKLGAAATDEEADVEEETDSSTTTTSFPKLKAAAAPATSKKLTSNGDGTYTLSLSVTGKTSSSTSTTVDKANVVLVLDTSNSMNNNNTTYNGKSMSRMNAMKTVLTETNGIIDQLLSSNTEANPDIIEIAVVDFGTRGTQQQDFTYNASTLKSTINGLSTSTGTNWEEGLQKAKTYADSIKASQSDEDVYIIFMTDGEPTTHANSYNPNNNTTGYQSNWEYANDDARALVTAGYKFYGIYTWGTDNNQGYPSRYLSSLVNYAYTGSGTYSSNLSSDYAEYFTNATDTSALVETLSRIASSITTGVGYTNVELTDGVTEMTTSSVKTTTGGAVSGLKYYRSGGDYSTTANNGLGEEWTDAPAATINENGEVDWDLGNTVLENGVTYTVTFVVWPSQKSVDLVADLNNGKVSYDSLTDAQKSQISITGGKYVLKTNTDYPTVTYSTVTTTTVDGETSTEISEPTTANITNPDPVGLAEAQMTVEKKWDDDLDPSQREEVKGEVVLDLNVDDKLYMEDITLNDDNDWKLENYVYIAPGLMVTEDSAAYDANATQVTYDGVTYAVLEEGHDYVFEEDDINNHFELTAYSHHPMLVGGVLKYVTFIYDDEGNITGISDIYDAATLSATNTLKGGINIEKKVVDADGDEVDTADPFTVTVNVTDSDGNALPIKTAKVKDDSGNDTTVSYNIDYRIYYGKNNPNGSAVTDDEGNITGYGRSEHNYVTGTSFEATLYVGDVIRVVNVENNAIFNVAETLGDDSIYELDSIKYSIATGEDEAKDYADSDTITKNNVVWYKVKGNSASNALVTNKLAKDVFYVYHSSDNTIERIAMTDTRIVNGKFNIVNEVKTSTEDVPTYLYGGYYKAYGGQVLTDDEIKALDYTTGDGWAKDDKDATPYTGSKATAWKNAKAYKAADGDAKGTEIEPVANTVYYLKEVPNSYLRPYIQVVYDIIDNNKITTLYMITAVDDANYTEVGFYDGSKDTSSTTLSATIKITKPDNNILKLTAKGVFDGKKYDDVDDGISLPRGYLTSISSSFNSQFAMQPYFKTLDGVKVYGVTNRTVEPGDGTFVDDGTGAGKLPGLTAKDATNVKKYE